MAKAGYLSTIYKPGTPTTMTAEATTLVSGKTYRITDKAKRVIDPATAVVVDDTGSPVAASDILDIDYLFGKVTFVGSYTPSGAITFDADYLPLAAIACARSFTFGASADIADDTCFNLTAVRSKKALLKDCTVGFAQLDDATPEFDTAFLAGTPLILVIGPGVDPVTADEVHIAARVVFESQEYGAEFDGLVESNLSAVCAPTMSLDDHDVSFGVDL